MLKISFALIIALHGFIHFMGFAKAFRYGNITQITKQVSKPEGICWFITACLFIVALALFLGNKEWWTIVTIAAIILSQILIVTVWSDAKFGTIANIIILGVIIYYQLKYASSY